MTSRLFFVWWRVRSSYWFLPSVMAVASAALAVTTVSVDRHLAPGATDDWTWVYRGGAAGARTVLSAVASSVITVAGVVFSITVAALTLASSQFGPRLLRNFMSDVGNQVVLGTFTGTEVYCLLVLRTIRGGDEGLFVPQLSVTLGVVLAMASMGVLIYFIHHISMSMQAPQVVAAVARDMADAIDKMFPETIAHPGPPSPAHPPGPDEPRHVPPDFETSAVTVRADGDGYLQFVNESELMEAARKHDLVIRLLHRPGHFLDDGSPFALVWPPDRASGEAVRRITRAVTLGSERTPTQDVEYTFLQLVEVAVRALSPGINDPFTAINCVDRLGAGLCRLARRRPPSAYRFDDAGRLRVIAHPVTFEGVLDASFDQVRQYGRTSVAVTIRLLEVLARVAERVNTDAARRAVLRQAEMIEQESRDAVPEGHDRSDVAARYEATLRAIRRGRGGEAAPQAAADDGRHDWAS